MFEQIRDGNASDRKRVKPNPESGEGNPGSVLDLPVEIMVHAMDFPNISDIYQCSMVNRHFQSICESNILWSNKCQSYFLIPQVVFEQKVLPMQTVDDDQETKTPVAMTPPPFSELFISDPSKSPLTPHNQTDPIIDKMNLRQQTHIEHLLFNEFGMKNQHIWCKLLFKFYFENYIQSMGNNTSETLAMYRKIRKLVNQLEHYLAYNSPKIYYTLQMLEDSEDFHTVLKTQKASLLDLDSKDNLPLEFKMLYMMMDGQSNTKGTPFGLFGGYEFYNYHANAALLPLSVCIHFRNHMRRNTQSESLNNTFPLVISNNVHIMIVTREFEECEIKFDKNNIVQISQGAPIKLYNSLLEWLETYITDLTVNQIYDIDKSGEIVRFPNSPTKGSDTTTNGVRIQCHSMMIPEMSRNTETELLYHFAYRVKITMDKNESKHLTCKLESRHWEIFEGDQMEEGEQVDGPGVIGLFPKIEPGTVFSYCSCTHSSMEIGHMRGYFTMRNTKDGQVFKAMIDPFPITTSNHL